MRRILVFLQLILIVYSGYSQEQIKSENIGDCSGAVSINKNESFEAEFTGKAGYNVDIEKYQPRLKTAPYNTFWLTIQTKVDGQLNANFSNLPQRTEVTFFKTTKDEACNDILAGKAEIVESNFLDKKENTCVLNVGLKAKNKYFIYLNTEQHGKPQFNIQTIFSDKRSMEQVSALQEVQDLREDRSTSTFTIHIVDGETNLPVETTVVVKNTKSFNALYAANTLRFPDSEYLSVDLEINAPGYFFKDQTVNRRTIKTDSTVIRLRPIKTDDQIELEGLQFESESDVLVESAKLKMRRLRDFLALNKDVRIEIIGHVHKEGRNTWKAKRLSKKRAKRVKSYLVDSGINEDRITTKGMGNAEMKFPEAKTDKEVQANRRVEIKIK